MTCTHLSELLRKENKDYQEQLKERKEYFDKSTGYDVDMYLVERDFQKRYFNSWAEHEKQEFCEGCSDKETCKVIR